MYSVFPWALTRIFPSDVERRFTRVAAPDADAVTAVIATAIITASTETIVPFFTIPPSLHVFEESYAGRDGDGCCVCVNVGAEHAQLAPTLCRCTTRGGAAAGIQERA